MRVGVESLSELADYHILSPRAHHLESEEVGKNITNAFFVYYCCTSTGVRIYQVLYSDCILLRECVGIHLMILVVALIDSLRASPLQSPI